MVQAQERAMESAVVVDEQLANFCRACGQRFCSSVRYGRSGIVCLDCNVAGDGLCCTCRYQMEKGVGNE
jgi:hypothetical protein